MQKLLFQKLKRTVATLMVVAFSFSLFPLQASAATLSNVTMLPASPYNPNSNAQVTFTYTLADLSGDALINAGIYDQNNIVKANLGTTTQTAGGGKTVTWNGKFDGNIKPTNGATYTFKVQGLTGPGYTIAVAPATLNFTIAEQDPAFTSLTVDTPIFNPNTDSDGVVKFTAKLDNIYDNKTFGIQKKVYKANNLTTPVYTFPNALSTNGEIITSWDGKIGTVAADPGDYVFEIYAYSNVIDEALSTYKIKKQVSFKVDNSNPVNAPLISNLKALPATFSPNGDNVNDTTSISFDVSKASETSIYLVGAGPFGSDALLYSTVTNVPTNVSYSWNGKVGTTTKAEGSYTIKVKTQNSDGNDQKTVNVTIDNNEAPAGVPVISNLKATPSTFSPNGDNVNDTTTLSFDLNESAQVTILLGSGAPFGSQVEIYKANKTAGNNITYTWNGKLPGDTTAMGSGSYTLVVEASNIDGSDSKTVNVFINNPTPSNNCGGFTDVPQDLCSIFQHAKEKGIFLGDTGTTHVRPYDIINRVEAAAVILRGFNMSMLSANGSKEGFSDVDVNQWYMNTGIVRSAKQYGILKGYPDGTLKPAQQVIRAELIVMFLRASGKTLPAVTQAPFLDTPLVSSTAWFVGSVNAAKIWGWINAGSYFYPSQGMTRADVARLFYDSYQAGLNK